MQQMMTPNSQPEPSAGGEQADQDGNSVTIAKNPDGTFTVNGKPAKTIEEALSMAREALTGDDGGMSVEQAFRGGFNGEDEMPMKRMGGMGGGY